MAFKGQFTYSIPVTSINIVDALPDNAVLPASVVGSIKGEILGISLGDLKASISSGLPDFIEYDESDKTLWNNGHGNDGSSTTFGQYALANNNSYGNTAFGYSALKSNTAGFENIAIGTSALALSSSSNFNLAIGNSAMGECDVTNHNIAIGNQALKKTIGGYNIAIGETALVKNTYGSGNIAIGLSSLGFNTTGGDNISMGYESMYNNTTGGENIAVGAISLKYNTTGSGNVAIGRNVQSGNYSGSVILGNDAFSTASNQFVVGSASYPAGTVTVGTVTQTRYWNVKINGTDYKILLAV